MRLKRGVTEKNNKLILKTFIIIIVALAIVLVVSQQNKKTSGLIIYNFGQFDNTGSLGEWQISGTINEGNYTIDQQTYYVGAGSLRGRIMGQNKTWAGGTLKQQLSTNMTQNGEYLNFYWRKSYEETTPIINNMSIILLRPDNSRVVLWHDETTNNNGAWNQESLQISSFNQQGEYYIILECDMKTGENATNTTTTSCWFDEITIDTQGSGGGSNKPIFYSYQETPTSPIVYNTSTVYEFKVSISDTDGKPWIDLDNANKSLTQTSGNTYKITISNLTAGIHNYYYWSWNAGSAGNRERNSSEIRTYQITKAAGEIKTIINGLRGDYTTVNGTTVCFSATAPEWADGQRTIYVNGQIYGNQSTNFQNCTSFKQTQTINIMGAWDGGTNYNPDFEEWQLRIIKESEMKKANETKIRIISPISTEYPSDTKELDFSLKSDTELKECGYSINGKELENMEKNSNNTEFSKKVKMASGIYEVLFLCKDNYGTIYNIQPLIKFKIKEQQKTGIVKKDNDTILYENQTCQPQWKCTDWSECSAVSYDPSEIISGKIEVRGEERRICYDAKICQGARIEEQVCELKIPIKAEINKWCEQNYIEIYDLTNNKLISRINEQDLGRSHRADIGFVNEGFGDYCNYCYDETKNYDETGNDCGGNNCPACRKKAEEQIIAPNNLRIALTIIKILVLGIIISYVFYWLIIRKLWSDEESEEIKNPALSLVREAIKKGYNKEQIRELFQKKGWEEREIDKLMREAEEK